ncbi:ADP-ribosyl cyclase/cyclic ADP-ribose hydrolase 1 [Elephas maximus indicus]|uniref:ADP-ribosyl cyclase/cyclic ADP-ribose hydrolase 1 n=1 Tax=Elephas maximus indicus TaxID=99487 RepID=UPI002116DF30|nr:ADP-ribosyl cyclase/cyclic ADP-ribose hydrolase 1 [Elephas maximus indicus]
MAQVCCIVFGLGALILATVAVTTGILLWRQGHLQWHGKGTTANISEIILRRCESYTPRKGLQLKEKNCKEIWKAFKNSFISKDPCSITEEDYLPLMKLTNQTVPCHQTLFWSKMPTLARQLFQDQRKVFSLEDLLLGSITDGLTWCGSRGTSEMNYQSCPDRRKDCSNNPVSVFWKTASKKFAADACGEVLALLNGSIPEPFDRNSIFGSVEILNLNSKAVHLLQAWVIHDAGDSRDSCLSSSINDLKSIITERNIRFTCQKEYRPARLV